MYCIHESRCKWLVISLVMLVVFSAAASEEIATGTPWTQPYFTRLDVTFPGGFHARWDIYRCACGDVLIHSEETLPDGITTGEQLLVGGRVLLQRGFADGGPAMLDSPMLMLQLLFVLLQKAEPSGPAMVDASMPVSKSDDNSPIMLDTGKAHGAFPAPWDLQGELRRVGDGSHRFELDFEFEAMYEGQSAGRSAMHLSGALNYQPQAFPHADDMALEGWSMHFIQESDEEIFADQSAETLAELRELVRKFKAME